MLNEPKFTIIVAVYNGEKTLQQCIDSVANQTYPNKELIIIDGGSTDATVWILQANQSKIAAWISEPDQGICDAWNKGIVRAKGDWICFLGADDYLWDETVLARIAAKLAELPPDIRVAYGRVMISSQSGQPLRLRGRPWNNVKRRIKQKMGIPHQGAMHRRDLFDDHGLFDLSFKIVGDYDFLLRELHNKDAAYLDDIIVSGMRVGGISNSIHNSKLMLEEFRRAQKKQGYHFPGFFWIKARLLAQLRILLCEVLGETRARKLFDQIGRISGKPAYWSRFDD